MGSIQLVWEDGAGEMRTHVVEYVSAAKATLECVLVGSERTGSWFGTDEHGALTMGKARGGGSGREVTVAQLSAPSLAHFLTGRMAVR